MRIIKHGTTILFNCFNCGCEFVVGKNEATTNDEGENYYAHCPQCGADCHADVNAIVNNKEDNK